MKKTFLTAFIVFFAISMTISFLPIVIYASEYPQLPNEISGNYVIYLNGDSGRVELAVINSDKEYSLMLEKGEQIDALNPGGEGKIVSDIPSFEKTRLYFSTESSINNGYFNNKPSIVPEDKSNTVFIESREEEYNMSIWVLSNDSWEYKETKTSNTICENALNIVETNLPVIEVLRKNKEIENAPRYLKFNGKEYYYCTDTPKKVLFSNNGYDYT